MNRSHLLRTLASAVAQGASFAVVSHLLAERRQRRSAPDAGAARLGLVERRLAEVELLLHTRPDVPLPASGVGSLGSVEQLPDEFPRVRPAASYLDEGSVYFEVGNYERAIDRFGRAIELQPDLCAAYFNRALACTRLGRFEAALADYDRAAALTPQDADIFNNRGLLHFERGELDAAAADFERAIKLQPDDGDARTNLALVQRHLLAE